MMEVQSQQAETLQQARSVLNEHKKWMSQKRAPVGASSTQSSAIQTTSNADEMEGLLKTPPSDTSRSSEKPKKKKKKKQNVTPVAEEKEGRISSRNPPNDGKKANEFGSTPLRSPKLPKPSPRVLSVSPAPQALQADLLDTTDTTLLRMEKCGRLAELKFRTLVEQEQKIGSIEQELKLALASIRSEVDPQVFQNASLKDVLPLIKDHVTREAYLRYVTALTTEEDKQKKEDTDEKRRRKKKKIEDGEKDSVGDHRLLNVSGQGEQDPNFDGKMVFVTHESSSGDNDEEKTVLSRISGKSRQLPVGGADENLPKSSMKVQSTGDSGSKSPQRVLKEARVKAKREKKKKSDSSTKLSTSSEKSESMDGLNSPRYLNVSSTLLDAKDSPKINHRDSLTLQNDSQSGNKVSSLSVSPLASDFEIIRVNVYVLPQGFKCLKSSIISNTSQENCFRVLFYRQLYNEMWRLLHQSSLSYRTLIQALLLWTTCCTSLSAQETSQCSEGYINSNDLPQAKSEWVAPVFPSGSVFATLSSMTFTCAGTVTGFRAWTTEDRQFSMYVYLTGLVGSSHLISGTPRNNLVAGNFTLPVRVNDVNKSLAFQLISGKSHLAFRQVPQKNFIQISNPLGANCSIFGVSTGQRSCAFQPLIQFDFVPDCARPRAPASSLLPHAPPYVLRWTHNATCFPDHAFSYSLSWSKVNQTAVRGRVVTTELEYIFSGSQPQGEYVFTIQGQSVQDASVVTEEYRNTFILIKPSCEPQDLVKCSAVPEESLAYGLPTVSVTAALLLLIIIGLTATVVILVAVLLRMKKRREEGLGLKKKSNVSYEVQLAKDHEEEGQEEGHYSQATPTYALALSRTHVDESHERQDFPLTISPAYEQIKCSASAQAAAQKSSPYSDNLYI